MSTHVSKVLSFMRKSGQYVGLKPHTLMKHDNIDRACMIMEEVLETVEAMGLAFEIDTDGNWDIVPRKDAQPISLGEIADGLADIQVTVTGTMLSMGLNPNHILNAVDDNNLLKFTEGCFVDEHGKLNKPPNHPKINWNHVLNTQQNLADVFPNFNESKCDALTRKSQTAKEVDSREAGREDDSKPRRGPFGKSTRRGTSSGVGSATGE
jgi:predicted HAD superfamily Cof-like phosphohydrolase